MKATDAGVKPTYETYSKDDGGNFSNTFFRYVRYWKLFLAFLAVSVLLAVIYLKKTPPTYEVKAKILLENTTNNNTNDFQDVGFLTLKSNADNELEVLNTTYLVEIAVRKTGTYAQYDRIVSPEKRENWFRQLVSSKPAPLYGADCPVSIRLPESALDTLVRSIYVEAMVKPDGSCLFHGQYNGEYYEVWATVNDSVVSLPFGPVYVYHDGRPVSETLTMGITLKNPSKVADAITSKLDIALTSKTTTAISIKLKTDNVAKGTDLVRAFLDAYREEGIREQEMLAQSTSNYLNELLGSLGYDLSTVEKRVESFKQQEGITDINSEAQLYIQRTGQYEQKRLEVGTQLGIVNDLETHINNPVNKDQLLPSGIGIQNASLNTLISEYNSALLERKRLSRTAAEGNQAMIDLNDRIDGLFRTIQSIVANEKHSLRITQQDINEKDNENAQHIRSIPRQERQISDLSRQQQIKSQLYLFLLQKRDEPYLSNASLTPKFKVISYPRGSGEPVEPKSGIIFLGAFVLGFFIPFMGITIRNLFHYTIEDKDELKQLSSVPILGVIPKAGQSKHLMIQENASDGFTEMFRLLRTNLLFVLNEPEKKVINVVSSINGEGKTLVTVNLALSLALLDKKVLMICLDVRKPMMHKVVSLDNETGMTQYLSGQLDRAKLVRPSGVHPGLFTITSGPVPPNPNELLAKPALDELIELYRNQFDYIVIDTPPIGAVSDSLLLNRFADVNLYIVRADYTPRKDIIDANDYINSQVLSNVYFVLNAADFRKTSSYYQYGYRRKYGYGYSYTAKK